MMRLTHISATLNPLFWLSTQVRVAEVKRLRQIIYTTTSTAQYHASRHELAAMLSAS